MVENSNMVMSNPTEYFASCLLHFFPCSFLVHFCSFLRLRLNVSAYLPGHSIKAEVFINMKYFIFYSIFGSGFSKFYNKEDLLVWET